MDTLHSSDDRRGQGKSQIEEHLLSVKGLSPHYQIELDKERHLDVMTVNVETTNASSNEANGEELARRIKTYIGVTAKVIVHDSGTIARSEGKAKRVIDNR